MNITEKAKMYAEGKALDAITSAIEKAYAEGYKDGFNDSEKNKASEFPRQIVEDGVVYVDLDLESGTRWSSSYLRDDKGRILFFTYEEALKLNIPTKEQFKEMINKCPMLHRSTTKGDYKSVVGTNGEHIELRDTSIHRGGDVDSINTYCFWLKNDNEPEKNMVECAAGNISYLKQFIGYKLPVMLVK